ncbi:MAG TPA: DUF4838 domain-containing protein [Candidatus Binatia bacterium]|nr:DUF4838 domain-containing protein [Candidatus Binatia bacterium]
MIDLGRLAAGDVLVPAGAAAPVAFAAEELAAYVGRLFPATPARRPVAAPGGDWLALVPSGAPMPPLPELPADAEWVVRPANGGAVLRGTSPRATLAAVYALLRAAGCRWSPHGRDDELVPAGAGVAALTGRPAFARRVYVADLGTWHYTVPERLAARLPHDVAFIDWMAKCDATGFLFIRHANDTQWTVPELLPELARRGLAIEGGGHALVELLPRSLFASHPEYFPLAATGRSDLGNACVSSPDAVALIRERATTARAEIPGATDFHLWGLDLFGGGWCTCPGCASLTPSDQSLVACNAAAEAMGGGRIFHLAYHDTIEPPARIAPHPHVWAEFAPRERCYGHALDDPGCATNAVYRRALDAHLERFAGRVDVFEYYGDAILFGGCAVPLVDVIGRDLECYRAAGVRGVSCLVFGQYSTWAYGVNVEAFARGTIDPRDAAGARTERASRRFAPAGDAMVRYLAALEDAMVGVVRHGDVLLPPDDAPTRAGVEAALGREAELRRLLADARAAGAPPARIAAEEHLLDYTVAVLAALRDWLRRRDRADAERALAALAATIAHVHAADPDVIGTWGAHDLELTHHFFVNALRAR